MREKILAALGLGLLATPMVAGAIPILELTDGVNSISVQDNGAGDVNPIAGVVTIVWTSPDTLWTSTVSIGTTYPADGSAADPYMDLNAVVTSPGTGNLTITFSQDGFLPMAGTFETAVGGTLNGNSSAVFAATAAGQAVSSLGPILMSGAFADSGSSAFLTAMSPYSIVLQAVITHGGGGTTSFDYELGYAPPMVVPEPGTFALLGLGLAGLAFARRRKTA